MSAVNSALDEIIAEFVPGEDVVAAEMFQKAGTWAGTSGGGFLGRLFGRGEEGPKGPEKFNALILTRERLHLIGCKSKGGSWVATEPIGSWDLGDLTTSARQEHTHMSRSSTREPVSAVETIQLSIDIGSERRNLALEGTLWGDESKAQETVEALLAATGGGEIAYG